VTGRDVGFVAWVEEAPVDVGGEGAGGHCCGGSDEGFPGTELRAVVAVEAAEC
jgi:hypothetical protein